LSTLPSRHEGMYARPANSPPTGCAEDPAGDTRRCRVLELRQPPRRGRAGTFRTGSDLDPGSVSLRGLHAGLDEDHALEPVVQRRIDDGRIGRNARAAGEDGAGRLGIDIGKTFQIALRVTGGNAAHPHRGGARSDAVARQQALRLAKRRIPEIVRIGLDPVEAPPGAIDTHAQAVFVAGSDLAAPEHALRANAVLL